ncbi:hypothetical protein PanWU01x14_323590 [Parasponia andersonii]|uniref:Uncharacterized protein n=1 Tax=Parasponia andersonii TaxID=3476 RepID=A0A2P5AKM2_PARAD|nr:hypothetical protein PanWU01x14_323590 [Parasponia andersonii]
MHPFGSAQSETSANAKLSEHTSKWHTIIGSYIDPAVSLKYKCRAVAQHKTNRFISIRGSGTHQGHEYNIFF